MLKLHHWLVCLLLMNVPVYGMLNSDKLDFSVYESYKKIIDERIQQGLKGTDLIKRADERDLCHLLERLVYADNSENNPRNCDYSDLRQRIIDYDPEVKKLDGFFEAFLTSLWRKRIKLTQWFIAEGVNVNLQPGKALESVLREIQVEAINQIIFIVKLLLLRNVNPNIQDEFGGTSLFNIVNIDPIGLDSRTVKNLCPVVQLLIVGGTDCSLKSYNNLGPGSKHNEKTAVESARIYRRFEFAETIERTVLQRDSLFAAVAKGKVIPFRSTNDKERESWTSRYHARTIHGDSLLHCAFAYNNLPVAQKLVYLWPQLLTQPNFKGETVLDLFPQKVVKLLVNSIL